MDEAFKNKDYVVKIFADTYLKNHNYMSELIAGFELSKRPLLFTDNGDR